MSPYVSPKLDTTPHFRSLTLLDYFQPDAQVNEIIQDSDLLNKCQKAIKESMERSNIPECYTFKSQWDNEREGQQQLIESA